MKTKITQLMVFLMLFAAFAVNAQVPASVGSWLFDDAGDMLKAEVGAPLELTGTQTSVPGPVAGNLATELSTGSFLKLTHGIAPNGGGTRVNEYTIMMDIQLPTLGIWHPFIQTNLANTDDADLWSRNNNTFLGTGALGYGTKALGQGVWYRMVISVQNGTSFNVYLNGEIALAGNVQTVDNARYSLAEAILLFADDTPSNANPPICSEVAVWDVALTEAQIIELGSVPIVPTTSMTVSGEGDVSIIDTDQGTLQMLVSVLPADATYQSAFWSVANGTGAATISSSGLLTGTADGTVTVTATAKDNPAVTATKEITISNQILVVDPVGHWIFDDAGDMLKAETGLPLELTGTQVSVPGPQTGNLATEIGTGSYLKLTHGIAPNGGGTKVNEYTIMMDVQLPTLGIFHPFIQTDITNTSDADLWARAVESTLGTGDLGYGTKAMMEGVWYRMVISVRNGTSFRVYMNTELFLEGNIQSIDNARYSLAEAILLFADNTPSDDNPVICSEVAVWDVTLTEPQVIELGSVPITLATSITVSGEGDVDIIDTDKGTLQMLATVLPVDATYQVPDWSVTNGTGSATISKTGLLTAVGNGTVTVTASSKGPSGVSGSKVITLSNQVVTINDFNMIKDGHFNTDGTVVPTNTLAPNWTGWSGNGGTVSVVGGVAKLTPSGAAESWQLQLHQIGNNNDWALENGVDYALMFDAWADADRLCSVDLEDRSENGYKRLGTSTDPDASNGTSDWTFNLTTTKTSYIRVFTCTEVVENTIHKFLISGGAAAPVAYFDDIYLLKMSDMATVPGSVPVSGITVTGEGNATTIDTDLGTLQMSAEILPVDATVQNIAWSVVKGTGQATIDSKGLLSAVYDGTVTVTATSKDWVGVAGTLEVTISNQQASIKENANMIKDGHFDVDGTVVPTSTLAPFWGGWSGNGGLVDVVDGVAVITPSAAAESWQLQLTQIGNDNEWSLVNDVKYALMFDAWAAADRMCSVDFEDRSENAYTRFGTSTDPDANGGNSDWTVNLTTTSQTFIRVFTCANVVENSIYKFLVSAGASDIVAYFDNIYLMTMADVGTLPDAVAVSEITVTGEGDAVTIDTDMGTLQMSAAILPADATIMNIGWSVADGTGSATIDASGLLTAATNGTVTVSATSQDWVGVSGSLEITLSGQTTNVKETLAKTVKVYPNPVSNELTVSFATPNATVAIYNSLGSKIEEVYVTGNEVKFDVRGYASGLYFVKVNNEAVVKFIK